jgi:hypothetical protein
LLSALIPLEIIYLCIQKDPLFKICLIFFCFKKLSFLWFIIIILLNQQIKFYELIICFEECIHCGMTIWLIDICITTYICHFVIRTLNIYSLSFFKKTIYFLQSSCYTIDLLNLLFLCNWNFIIFNQHLFQNSSPLPTDPMPGNYHSSLYFFGINI